MNKNINGFIKSKFLTNGFTLAEVFLRHFDGQRRTAFTLAEVLITLGIIGVVAAMTLPSLIANYEKQRTAVAVKKVYAELQQVLKMAVVQYGDIKFWDLASESSIDSNREFTDKYIKPFYKGFNYIEDGKGNANIWSGGISERGINGAISNGTIISINVSAQSPYFLIDVNGYKKPNRIGNDIFIFNIDLNKEKLVPIGWKDNLTRDMIFNGYSTEFGANGTMTFSCKKEKLNETDSYSDYRHACTALLMLDGWEFKDDYPW